jgi:hypothetical protein
MKQDYFSGMDFKVHLCKDRYGWSRDENYPYQMVISSQFAFPIMSKDELLDLADFIKEFVENNNG